MPGVCSRLPLFLLTIALCAGCREKGDIKIASLTFDGVEQVDKKALTNSLQTRKGSILPWGAKTYFDRKAFDDDLKRIDAFYRDRGFPDARVTSFDVDLNDAQDSVKVIVHISEGEPIRVAALDMTGFDVLDAGQQMRLQESLPLKAEAPLDRQLAVATRERALNTLRDQGYPYAKVGMRSEDAGPRRQWLILEAEPGQLAHFGVIDIRGEGSVSENVIRRQLNFNTGDRFTRTKMRESQQKLYGLELFEFANIESLEEKDLESAEVPVRVTVAEGKHRKIQTGLGYGSEEKARARIRWDHVNFFGGARHAAVEAKWSSLDRGVRLEYTQPYLFTPNLSMRFEGQAWQAEEPVYSLRRLGGRAVLQRQATRQTTMSVALINEYEQSSIADEALTDFTVRDDLISLGLDPRSGETRGTVSGVAFDFNRNTTNNLLDARRGYSVTGHVEQASQLLWGTYRYLATSGEARHYVPVGGRMVFANRLAFGAIRPGDNVDANVPFSKRYFAGGASSIRGWGRYEVSPLSGFGFPIGGLSMLVGTTEVRMPIAGNLGAVAFLDFGNVWEQSWNFDLGELRYAVGPGLRYLTPIGPIRIDVGYQLNPIDNLLVNGEPQKRQFRLHFSIGQAF
jgi:outer membrane protein assembly complex protein YaeT